MSPIPRLVPGALTLAVLLAAIELPAQPSDPGSPMKTAASALGKATRSVAGTLGALRPKFSCTAFGEPVLQVRIESGEANAEGRSSPLDVKALGLPEQPAAVWKGMTPSGTYSRYELEGDLAALDAGQYVDILPAGLLPVPAPTTAPPAELPAVVTGTAIRRLLAATSPADAVKLVPWMPPVCVPEGYVTYRPDMDPNGMPVVTTSFANLIGYHFPVKLVKGKPVFSSPVVHLLGFKNGTAPAQVLAQLEKGLGWKSHSLRLGKLVSQGRRATVYEIGGAPVRVYGVQWGAKKSLAMITLSRTALSGTILSQSF